MVTLTSSHPCVGIHILHVYASMRKQPKPSLFIWMLHGLAWVVGTIYAYLVAGSYQFFNCWLIILVYAPPLALLGILPLIVSAYWFITHRSKPNIRFFVASHILLAGAGLFVATIAASLGVDQFASCL